MSARAVATGPEIHSAETLLSQDVAQSSPLSETTTGGFAYGGDHASETRDEFLRRYEVPLCLQFPWYHGGLNE